MIDAYCGIGTIGLLAAKRAGNVIGVELNPDAVRDAIGNAKGNQITNARFFSGDAGEFMIDMADQAEKADVVFMDPPRSGEARKYFWMRWHVWLRKVVVYISCGPETQARCRPLLGYRAEGAWPVDMFPMTDEIENICLLKRV